MQSEDPAKPGSSFEFTMSSGGLVSSSRCAVQILSPIVPNAGQRYERGERDRDALDWLAWSVFHRLAADCIALCPGCEIDDPEDRKTIADEMGKRGCAPVWIDKGGFFQSGRMPPPTGNVLSFRHR